MLEAPRTTLELLDVATKYATGEETVLANFSGKGKAIAPHSGGDGDDEANVVGWRRNKRKKDKKCH
jgi:hypothetical protein